MATVKYPVPVFHFTVSYGGSNVDFTEVSGLSISVNEITYRGGASPNKLPLKMAGLPTINNISLKKGMFKADEELYNWFSQGVVNQDPNSIDRRDLTIHLMDPAGNIVATWNIKAAWPLKYDGPSLNSTGNDVAVESVELAHEGIEQIIQA